MKAKLNVVTKPYEIKIKTPYRVEVHERNAESQTAAELIAKEVAEFVGGKVLYVKPKEI